jgi:hypothetical protein
MREFLKAIADLVCFTKQKGPSAEVFFDEVDHICMANAVEEDGLIRFGCHIEILGKTEDVDKKIRAIIAVLSD